MRVTELTPTVKRTIRRLTMILLLMTAVIESPMQPAAPNKGMIQVCTFIRSLNFIDFRVSRISERITRRATML